MSEPEIVLTPALQSIIDAGVQRHGEPYRIAITSAVRWLAVRMDDQGKRYGQPIDWPRFIKGALK